MAREDRAYSMTMTGREGPRPDSRCRRFRRRPVRPVINHFDARRRISDSPVTNEGVHHRGVMKNNSPGSLVEKQTSGRTSGRIPLWLKLAYTAFMAVLIPVYWKNYGPTNFLYFCDVALLLTLAGIWTGNRLLVSMSAVGILLPQALWCVDFTVQLTGHKFTGMTAYMFDPHRSVFLRGLSFFHGWLPFLLIYLVAKLGYDRRAWPAWTLLGWSLCLVAFFALPPAGAVLANPRLPVNVNYVFGLSDTAPQLWLPAGTYLALWMSALALVVYTPTHWVLRRWFLAEAPAPMKSGGR